MYRPLHRPVESRRACWRGLRFIVFGALVGVAVALTSPVAWAQTCTHPQGAVELPALGDVNGNGVSNVADAMCVVLGTLSVQAGGDPGDVPCFNGDWLQGDVSCDGAIDIVDAQACIHIALGFGVPSGLDPGQDGCPAACESCAPSGLGSCLIDGACVGEEARDLADDCLVCDPAQDPAGYSVETCQDYYRDEDEDEFGVTGDSVCRCTAVAPYSAVVDGDCDDSDPDVSPASPEICGDGIDQDCDGDTDEGCSGGLGTIANPAQSCKAILDSGSSQGSGAYWVNATGTAELVYCDMTTDGGGWTRCASQTFDANNRYLGNTALSSKWGTFGTGQWGADCVGLMDAVRPQRDVELMLVGSATGEWQWIWPFDVQDFKERLAGDDTNCGGPPITECKGSATNDATVPISGIHQACHSGSGGQHTLSDSYFIWQAAEGQNSNVLMELGTGDHNHPVGIRPACDQTSWWTGCSRPSGTYPYQATNWCTGSQRERGTVHVQFRERPLPPLGQPGNPASSCRALFEAGLMTSSGPAWLNASGQDVQVVCDMDTDGGMWTRCASQNFSANNRYLGNTALNTVWGTVGSDQWGADCMDLMDTVRPGGDVEFMLLGSAAGEWQWIWPFDVQDFKERLGGDGTSCGGPPITECRGSNTAGSTVAISNVTQACHGGGGGGVHLGDSYFIWQAAQGGNSNVLLEMGTGDLNHPVGIRPSCDQSSWWGGCGRPTGTYPYQGTNWCTGAERERGTVKVQFRERTVCGDGHAWEAEECDGADLRGETCASQGFAGGGTLACEAGCGAFDTSGCLVASGDPLASMPVGPSQYIEFALTPTSDTTQWDLTGNITTGLSNSMTWVAAEQAWRADGSASTSIYTNWQASGGAKTACMWKKSYDAANLAGAFGLDGWQIPGNYFYYGSYASQWYFYSGSAGGYGDGEGTSPVGPTLNEWNFYCLTSTGANGQSDFYTAVPGDSAPVLRHHLANNGADPGHSGVSGGQRYGVLSTNAHPSKAYYGSMIHFDAFLNASQIQAVYEATRQFYPGHNGNRNPSNYYGDGSDGAGVFGAGTTMLTVGNKQGPYDGDMVVRQYTTLDVQAGATLTTDQPGRGLVVFVQGDANIAGTLTMTARGAAVDPAAAGVSAQGLQFPYGHSGGANDLSTALSTPLAGAGAQAAAIQDRFASVGPGTLFTIARAGAAGGLGCPDNCPSACGLGNSGATGQAGQAGGGGSGAGADYFCPTNAVGGRGAAGTCFSGGPGGGGGDYQGSAPAGQPGGVDGGAGGNAGDGGGDPAASAGGGAGNPGGQGESTHQFHGEDGTGGLLVLIVGGNLTVSGTISANGSAGGSGNTDWKSTGGGGSGGGSILILHRGGIDTTGGTIEALGGQGGQVSSGFHGGDGGDGSVQGPYQVD